MKKRGMSWTIKGAQRMARLITLREMGQLHSRITRKDKLRESQPSKKEIGKEKLIPGKDVGTWRGAGLLALYGPQQNRP